MNNKKIAFIICANSERYLQECVWYLEQLTIPLDYEREIINVKDAEDITEAYNAAMQSSDAKYKVYLHQDVFIFNKNFIIDLIQTFQSDEKLGLLGVIGGVNLPANAITWNAWNRGCTFACNNIRGMELVSTDSIDNEYTEVEAVDGMLMATQYDIPWREDLQLGWDFYDISQSLEFRRKGYKVGIPYQKIPWCMHDCGHSKLSRYDEARKKILVEYCDYFNVPFEQHYSADTDEIEKNIFEILKNALENHELKQAIDIYNMVKEYTIRNNDLQYAMNIVEIGQRELEADCFSYGFFRDCATWEKMKDNYIVFKFAVWHIAGENYDAIAEILPQVISLSQSMEVIIEHSAVNPEKTKEIYRWLRN